MKLSFDFELGDWEQFLRAAWIGTPDYRRRRMWKWVLSGILLLGMGCVLVFIESGDYPFAFEWPEAVVGLIAGYVVFFGRIYDWRAMRAAMREMRRGDNRTIFSRRELELTPEGVRSVSGMGEGFYKAAAIQRVMETPRQLLLFVAAMQAIIIPRAKIPPEEFEAAAVFAREHYGKAQL
jgi:hypothetical protein